MKSVTVFSLRLNSEQTALLGELGQHTKQPKADILRDALVHYAGSLLNPSDIQKRRQVTFEFLYLVADKFLADSSPELYTDLMSEAKRRAEALYADS